jgi:hypothetical protein
VTESVAVFSVTPLWEIHNSQMIDLAYDLSNEGLNLIVFHCTGTLFSCRANPQNLKALCSRCRKQSNWNIKSLLPTGTANIWIKDSDLQIEQIERLEGHDDLFSVQTDDFPVGRAVISQLQTIYRETIIPSSIINSTGFEILSNAVALYRYFIRQFQKEKPKKVLTFGGRYAAERAFISAAQKMSIPFETFETGSKRDRIWVSKVGEMSFNSYNLDVQEKLASLGKESDFLEILNEGQIFFDQWKDGSTSHPNLLNPNVKINEKSEKSNLEEQISKVINNSAKEILTIFTSTDYEVKSFDDYKILGDSNLDQTSVIKAMSKSQSLLEKYEIFVRWHPNSNKSGPLDKERNRECILESKGIFHIRASDNLNSYTLLDQSNVIVTFGSTMGIEAAAKGKISILAATSAYSNLEAVHEPSSLEELFALLSTDLRPLPVENALKWGWWKNTFGMQMKYVKLSDNNFYLESIPIKCHYLRSIEKYFAFKHRIKSAIVKTEK